MPSISPIYNAKLQSTLDLNSKSASNFTVPGRYPVVNLNSNTTITSEHMGKYLIFDASHTVTLNASIAGVYPGANFYISGNSGSTPLVQGTATILNSILETIAPGATRQFICVAAGNWIVLNAN